MIIKLNNKKITRKIYEIGSDEEQYVWRADLDGGDDWELQRHSSLAKRRTHLSDCVGQLNQPHRQVYSLCTETVWKNAGMKERKGKVRRDLRKFATFWVADGDWIGSSSHEQIY